MQKIAIFASGSGTNAEQIIKHFFDNKLVNVSYIITDNPRAGVIKRAYDYGIELIQKTKKDIYEGNDLAQFLAKEEISLLVLAGYLGKIGDALLQAFPQRIMNIHPALLPKYGGKGMYGDRVHQAVIQSNDTRSGITIHIIDQEYDRGIMLCQVSCAIRRSPDPNPDTPESLAEKIHRLEHRYYPLVIEDYLQRIKS